MASLAGSGKDRAGPLASGVWAMVVTIVGDPVPTVNPARSFGSPWAEEPPGRGGRYRASSPSDPSVRVAALGSSDDSFAQVVYIECTTLAGGRGYCLSTSAMRSQFP